MIRIDRSSPAALALRENIEARIEMRRSELENTELDFAHTQLCRGMLTELRSLHQLLTEEPNRGL